MRTTSVLLAACLLAALTMASVSTAGAVSCVVGDDPASCAVSVQSVVCVRYPCDAVIVCVDHGLICSNRDLP